jgi:molybdate transport system substrate-binding protein
MNKFMGLITALVMALPVPPVRAEAPVAPPPGKAAAGIVTVFAAASLKNALDIAAAAFEAKTGLEVRISYAGSMALARQIEAAAPAEVFIPADEASMDYLAGKNLIQPDTRFDFLGNTLVVIAPRTAKLEKLAFTKDDLAATLGPGRITTGDPVSVPVGKYAKAALEKLGLWSSLEPKFAYTDNVRAALAFVAREEAPLGIVYLTDARSEPKVKVVATFPAGAHPPIVYPVALTSTATGDAPKKLLTFLESKTARDIFIAQGFTLAP